MKNKPDKTARIAANAKRLDKYDAAIDAKYDAAIAAGLNDKRDAAEAKFLAAINAAARRYTAAVAPHLAARARARAAGNAILCDADVAYHAAIAPHLEAHRADIAAARAEYDEALVERKKP